VLVWLTSNNAIVFFLFELLAFFHGYFSLVWVSTRPVGLVGQRAAKGPWPCAPLFTLRSLKNHRWSGWFSCSANALLTPWIASAFWAAALARWRAPGARPAATICARSVQPVHLSPFRELDCSGTV
jgi:hypothetical protein